MCSLSNGKATTDVTWTTKIYGFDSKKTPPIIDDMKHFEEDLALLISSVEFRRVSDPFQDMLRKDAERIRKCANMFVKADKTRNLYEMKPEQYSKLLRDNITKHYKLAPGRAYKDIHNAGSCGQHRTELK